ncbi:MAG: RagB/SusD family nutrient uptake outer membrane protein, partial [Bacteroidaceae bacterium]
MKNKNKYIITLLLSVCLLLPSCTNLDEIWYNRVTEDTFFKDEHDVLAALYRPFTHARWYEGESRWKLQEVTADQMVTTQKGQHWWNGGENHRYLHHEWTPDDGWIWDSWRGATMGIALAIDTKISLENVDYSAFAMTEEDKKDHINQLNSLMAYFYLRGLDFFGPFIIFENPAEPVVGRRKDTEVFKHTESLLLEALDNLHAKEKGQAEEGRIRKAAAATMLARLYFNAESYIKENRFDECEKICQDIIDGKYGYYELDETWNAPHGFNNDKSTSVIWSFPSAFKRLEYNWFYADFYHYNAYQYFDIDGGANNGLHLQPSRYPGGKKTYLEDFKLGCPYEKFDDKDLRKKPYVYKGGTNYEGLFMVGEQKTPTGKVIVGTQEYKDEPLIMVDYVAKMKTLEAGKDPETLRSTLSDGEENTGIRLVKAPIPNKANNDLRWGADHPVLRLEEVYFMLA